MEIRTKYTCVEDPTDNMSVWASDNKCVGLEINDDGSVYLDRQDVIDLIRCLKYKLSQMKG